MNRKSFSIIGAGFGLVLFLAIALLPAMVYGGYAGVLLAGGIFGTPITPSFLVRTLIIGGMMLGTLSIASLFMVMGAVLGSVVSLISEIPGNVLARMED